MSKNYIIFKRNVDGENYYLTGYNNGVYPIWENHEPRAMHFTQKQAIKFVRFANREARVGGYHFPVYGYAFIAGEKSFVTL